MDYSNTEALVVFWRDHQVSAQKGRKVNLENLVHGYVCREFFFLRSLLLEYYLHLLKIIVLFVKYKMEYVYGFTRQRIL